MTLTFSDAYLPEDYSVNVRDLQLFMKRFRKALGHNRVRFFACGEYGGDGHRPHYHLLVFGYDFPDKTLWKRSYAGDLLYRSEFLEKVWPFGHAWIGTVTMQSINYVARYIVKKVNGEAKEEHYIRVHPLTGEVCRVEPEFITHSQGIGLAWFKKYGGDAFPSDFVIIDGQKRPVPRYYKKKLTAKEDRREADAIAENATRDPEDRKRLPRRTDDQVVARRLQRAASPRSKANNTPERLEARQESATLKLARLKRELENDT